MPITPEQFTLAAEKQRASAGKTVQHFLKAHRLAYSVDELAEALSLNRSLILDALVDLDYEGVLDCGTIDGTMYYIYRAA